MTENRTLILLHVRYRYFLYVTLWLIVYQITVLRPWYPRLISFNDNLRYYGCPKNHYKVSTKITIKDDGYNKQLKNSPLALVCNSGYKLEYRSD